jgi:Ca2+-binding RTX toxin-like protein
VNRIRQGALVLGTMLAVALSPAVSAQSLELDNVAGDVDLTVADVVTGGVEITSPATATLTGTIDPNSIGTEYYFEFGPNGNLTFRTDPVSLGANLDPRQVTAEIPGLEPGTAYSYRLTAKSPLGFSVGQAESFQTAPAAGAKASKCTIRGTSRKDVLRGTRKRDVICGLGGGDTIRSLGGNDVIRAGNGGDRVTAGAGRDRILGNAGNDRLFGQSGADRLYGQRGKDRLDGGKGRDRVFGGQGRDRAKVQGRDRLRSVERSSRR